jgi:hypothetical protein
MQTTVFKKNCSVFSVVLGLMLTVMELGAQTIEVRGIRSCGEWVKDKDTLAFGNQTWLVGYLSGLAVATNKQFLSGTDNQSIYLWVDNYCRANPLRSLPDAGTALYYELVKQKKL